MGTYDIDVDKKCNETFFTVLKFSNFAIFVKKYVSKKFGGVKFKKKGPAEFELLPNREIHVYTLTLQYEGVPYSIKRKIFFLLFIVEMYLKKVILPIHIREITQNVLSL